MKVISIPENSVEVNVQKMHYTLQKIKQMVFFLKNRHGQTTMVGGRIECGRWQWVGQGRVMGEQK